MIDNNIIMNDMMVSGDNTTVINDDFMKLHLNKIRCKKNVISTGYYDLDYQWGGLNTGETYLIGARPAMGKTAFAINVVRNIALKDNNKIAYFTLGQSKELLVNLLLARESLIKESCIRNGDLEDSEWDSLMEASRRIGISNIIINDELEIDTERLEQELYSEKMKGVRVVFIDDLQRLSTNYNSDSQRSQIFHIAQKLKQIAVKYNVAEVVLSRISSRPDNRADHRPKGNDFVEFGMRKCFDNVSLLYRDDYYDPNNENKGTAEVITIKSQSGKEGVVKLAYLPDYQIFANIEPDWEED